MTNTIPNVPRELLADLLGNDLKTLQSAVYRAVRRGLR